MQNDSILTFIHRIATALWIVLNGSIGILGNLLTLCAIPYAKRRQRFGFRPGWDGTSIAIMVRPNLNLICKRYVTTIRVAI